MRIRCLVFLALLFLVVPGCSGPGGGAGAAPAPAGEEPVAVSDAGSVEDDSETEVAVDEPLRTAAVEIYFPSAEYDGLVGEYREIFATATPGDRAKQIVADLISGPMSTTSLRAVPPSTRLRQVYVLADGTAYLDFSPELTEGIGGGSMKELLTVYAIVDSVAYNVREVHRVAILINGRPIETMNGHLDLRAPLKPNPRWIIGSNIVDARRSPARAATGTSG